MIKNYDVIEAHVPYALNLQLTNKPYLIYEAGWMSTLINKSKSTRSISFNAYKKSKGVINTNPYLYNMFKEFPVNKDIRFVPFAIDTERYAPMKVNDIKEQLTKNNEYLVLGMARQNWSVKGSHILIQAFKIFHKKYPKSRLLLMKWGIDLNKSKYLIKKTGLSDCVTWLPFMPKSKLILIYNAVDIACDQFVIGGWGTSYPECMSTRTPVLLYYENDYIIRAFGSLPPTPSVKTKEDIAETLIKYYEGNNKFSDQDCRDWIVSTHNMVKVGNMHKEILEDKMK